MAELILSAVYYLLFLLGAASAGLLALRIGGFPFPDDENAKWGYGAVAGAAITIFALLADFIASGSGNVTAAAGIFPILFTITIALAAGMISFTFKGTVSPAPAVVTAAAGPEARREEEREMEMPTFTIETGTASGQSAEPEEKISITHGVQRAAKQKPAAVPLPAPPKPPEAKKAPSVTITPGNAPTPPRPATATTPRTPQTPLPSAPLPPKRVPDVMSGEPPWIKREKIEAPPKPAPMPPVEQIEGHKYPRRSYLKENRDRPAQLIESKPPEELKELSFGEERTHERQLSPAEQEKQEIESLLHDTKEAKRFEQRRAELEERRKKEELKRAGEKKTVETGRPATAKPAAATTPAAKKAETKQEVSMNDLFGPAAPASATEAKPSGVFAQLDAASSGGGDLFSQLNDVSAGKATPATAATPAKATGPSPLEKGKCPNCGSHTTRIVFCPHCGNAMCATCASSIAPSPEGFEYVCPHCGEKVRVKKKA